MKAFLALCALVATVSAVGSNWAVLVAGIFNLVVFVILTK
jgi:hypothetical protein